MWSSALLHQHWLQSLSVRLPLWSRSQVGEFTAMNAAPGRTEHCLKGWGLFGIPAFSNRVVHSDPHHCSCLWVHPSGLFLYKWHVGSNASDSKFLSTTTNYLQESLEHQQTCSASFKAKCNHHYSYSSAAVQSKSLQPCISSSHNMCGWITLPYFFQAAIQYLCCHTDEEGRHISHLNLRAELSFSWELYTWQSKSIYCFIQETFYFYSIFLILDFYSIPLHENIDW